MLRQLRTSSDIPGCPAADPNPIFLGQDAEIAWLLRWPHRDLSRARGSPRGQFAGTSTYRYWTARLARKPADSSCFAITLIVSVLWRILRNSENAPKPRVRGSAGRGQGRGPGARLSDEERVVPSPVLVEVDRLLRRCTKNESFSAVIDQVRRGALVIEDLVAVEGKAVANTLHEMRGWGRLAWKGKRATWLDSDESDEPD